MFPLVFLSHGGPGGILSGENEKAIEFWSKELAPLLLSSRTKPKAIIFLSAHWYDKTIMVNSNPRIIHDFGEFFPGIHDISYESPAVPDNVLETVRKALKECTIVDRGLDHGSWIPMYVMDPKGHVPVIQIALPYEPEDLIALGTSLAGLLTQFPICCSGGSVHNLPHALGNLMRRSKADEEAVGWARSFEGSLEKLLESGIKEGGAKAFLREVLSWETFSLAHPTPDHFYPMLVAAAIASAAHDSGIIKARKIYDEFLYGSLAMSIYSFSGKGKNK